MFFIMFAVSLVPKLLGMLDILLTPGAVARYGGSLRFLAGGLVETVMSVLMAPVVALRVSLFLLGLAVGKSVIWGAQNRDAYRLGWSDAARGLWPQTVFGLGLTMTIVAALGWEATLWAAPMLAGLCLAIPFAVVTAHPALGRLARRFRLCAVPDEIEMPASLTRTGYFRGSEREPGAAGYRKAA